MIAWLGIAGLGLTWGWLVGQTEGPLLQTARGVCAQIAATTLLGMEVLLLAGAPTLPVFLGGTCLAMLLHVAWRRELRLRFG
jgi:hypothetical protein